MSDERDPSIAAAHGRDSNRSEDDAVQPRQPLPDAPIATAFSSTDGNHLRSISRLHDDELSCVLPFLALKDLAQLVRCSRRFNGVARKERNRGLRLKGDAAVVPLLLTSVLSHHVSSLHLNHYFSSDAPVTRDTLRRLCDLPRLTALQLSLQTDESVNLLMQGLSPETAAAALRAVLPTQLRSFGVTTGTRYSQLSEQTAALASAFLAALGDMTQLSELSIEQRSERMHVRPELAHLLHLRKLRLGPIGGMDEHVGELKQLNQLRELILSEKRLEHIRLLCQPPHALRLESISLPFTTLDEATMRALLHLPTLTALNPNCIRHDAWPLLPQLPLLRRLRLCPPLSLTPNSLASLCDSLARCSTLEDLTPSVRFVSANHTELTAVARRAGWAALLSSVPNLRRLSVSGDLDALFPVLPSHLPLLESLSLSGTGSLGVAYFARMGHPNLQQVEWGLLNKRAPSAEQLRLCMRSERLPKLERCDYRANCVT
jgi:hypothetical protein